MGMRPQLTAPGVQYPVESNGGAQSFRVMTEVQQGLGRLFKQQVIHDPSVILADRVELMRQGKDTMVIRYRQQIIQPGINPSSLGSIIATRTMTVTTGVIPFLHMTAGITDLPVGTELTAPAMLNVVHDLVLPWVQTMFGSELITMLPEYISEIRA